MATKKTSSKITNSEDMQIDSFSLVSASNTLIAGRQSLKPNEAKLVRLCIAQIMENDVAFKPYKITISELANLLGLKNSSSLYRDIKDMCEHIVAKPILISSGKSWKAFPWVSYCEYIDNTSTVTIKLNDELKPFLLELKEREFYTKYAISNILQFKNIYTIRLYELLQVKLTGRIPMTSSIGPLRLSVQEIREACECLDKYEKFGMFKASVIEPAVDEINSTTTYSVSYDCVREGRKVMYIDFTISSRFGVTDR